jgi:hypothetical protein
MQVIFVMGGLSLGIFLAVQLMEALSGRGALQVKEEEMKMAAMATAALARDSAVDKALGAAQSSSISLVANASSYVSHEQPTDAQVAELAKNYADAIGGLDVSQATGIDVVGALFIFIVLLIIIDAIHTVAGINTEFDKHAGLLMSIQEGISNEHADTCAESDSMFDAYTEYLAVTIETVKDKAERFPVTIFGFKITWGMLLSYMITFALALVNYSRDTMIKWVTDACVDFGSEADSVVANSSTVHNMGISVNVSGMVFEMLCLPLRAGIQAESQKLGSWVNNTLTDLS